MIGSETDEIIEERFEYLLQRKIRRVKKGSNLVFNSVDTLYYNLNKISLSRGGLYVDSPEWLKNKRATINPKHNDDKCFQYALTAALNYQNIKKSTNNNKN